MQGFALRLSKNRWLQGYAFVFLLLLTSTLLTLPLDVYRHHVSLTYGFSVQGWASWLGDMTKSFLLTWLIGGLLVMILFWVIRKSPTRWWLWFSMVAIAFTIGGVFITPYVIDPMFNKFEPLSKSDPELVARLEQVVARGGIAIPPERMFLMKASAKVTTMNAYVTGFGASKRVVVWDTTIAKATPDEIAMIFAHEMGHYALNHVVIGVAASCFGLLPFFWLGYHATRLLLRRYGERWGIASQQDWGALVVLLLVLSVLSTLSDPISNAVSRMIQAPTPMCTGKRRCTGSSPIRGRWGSSRSRCWGRSRSTIPRRTRSSNSGSTTIRQPGFGLRLPRRTIHGPRASAKMRFAVAV